MEELKLSMKNKETKLIKIFETILNVKKKEFKDSLSTKNCKSWDSLNHIKIIIALQEDFNLKISPIEQNNLLSVKIIKKFIEKNKN